MIFRASSRGRSRPGAPLQQIWTTARPESSQEPHAHHRAGAPATANPDEGGRALRGGAPGRFGRPRPADRPAWRDGVSHVVTPPTRDPSAALFSVRYAPSLSAAPLFPVQRRVKGRSRGRTGAAGEKPRGWTWGRIMLGRTGAAGAKGRGGRSPDAPNRKSYPPVSRDFSAGSASHSSEPETAKVSHCASEPESMPVVNHRTRCSDEPCVQVSESTPLPERCWMWSSPTAAAASSAV